MKLWMKKLIGQIGCGPRLTEDATSKTTLDDLKNVVGAFMEELSDDFTEEMIGDKAVNAKLEELKKAVEANSIDQLRAKSKEFIQLYMIHHAKKDHRRLKRMRDMRKRLNLEKIKVPWSAPFKKSS